MTLSEMNLLSFVKTSDSTVRTDTLAEPRPARRYTSRMRSRSELTCAWL
jgi:hypothetical protein